MSALVRIPHGLIRRYLSVFERLVVALLTAALVNGLMQALPAYPPYWGTVLVALVFAGVLWSPTLGYILAVAAVAYPLYHLSFYVAVLFLAVAALGFFVFVNNLGGTLLTLAAPWLAPLYLPWMVPLLGGLWWGATGGAVMGGLSVLWGQLAAGMAGLPPDWLLRLGVAPQAGQVALRFADANSFETLKLILEPLAPDSTTLLYLLLQILLGAFVGGMIGTAADRSWMARRQPWGNIGLGAAGALLLLIGNLSLGLWLERFSLRQLGPVWLHLLVATVLPVLLIGTLESLRDLLEHPLPMAPLRRPGMSRRAVERRATSGRTLDEIPASPLTARQRREARQTRSTPGPSFAGLVASLRGLHQPSEAEAIEEAGPEETLEDGGLAPSHLPARPSTSLNRRVPARRSQLERPRAAADDEDEDDDDPDDLIMLELD